MPALGRGSLPWKRFQPMANQWMPYALNASAAMYRGLSVNTWNQVRPTNRMMPVISWQSPGRKIPQTPIDRSTTGSRAG
jgi:hypothetical protein